MIDLDDKNSGNAGENSGYISPRDFGNPSKQESNGLPQLNGGDDRGNARSGLFKIAPSQAIVDNERQQRNLTINRELDASPVY